jgi:hypothetical protein
VTLLDDIESLCTAAEGLAAAIRDATAAISIEDARAMIPVLRDAEGWLQGARSLLDPTRQPVAT